MTEPKPKPPERPADLPVAEEIKHLEAIVEAFKALPPQAQQRAFAYIASRFGLYVS